MKIAYVAFILASLLLVLGFAFNAEATHDLRSKFDIKSLQVYVNDNLVWSGSCREFRSDVISFADGITRSGCSGKQLSTLGLERDSTAQVRVVFNSGRDVEEIHVSTWISGYRKDIEAKTAEFDTFAGNTYSRTLLLQVPKDIDAKDTYTLHVRVEAKQDLSGVDEASISTNVQRLANELEILSLNIYDREGETLEFKAGQTLFADVVVKNRGNHMAEDAYVKLSIPELGLERTVYLGDLGREDGDIHQDTRRVTLSLKLPSVDGEFDLEVESFNGETSDKQTRQIKIEKLVVTEEEKKDSVVTATTPIDVKLVLMIVGLILAAVIIVLLVVLLLRQEPMSKEEMPEVEGYY